MARSSRDITIDIDVSDSLSDVLGRLRGLHKRTIHLLVPPGTPLLLTAIEFRQLREAVDGQGLELKLYSDDSLRRQLASVFGIAIGEPPEEGAAPEPEALPPPRREIRSHLLPRNPWRPDDVDTDALGSPAPVPRDEVERLSKTTLPEGPGEARPLDPMMPKNFGNRDSDAPRPPAVDPNDAGSESVSPSTNGSGVDSASWRRPAGSGDRRTLLPPLPEDRRRGKERPIRTVGGAITDEDAVSDAEERAPAAASRLSWRWIAAAIGAVALTAVIAYVIAIFFVLSAEIEIALKQQPVAVTLTYSVVAPGVTPSGDDLTIAAEPRTLEVTLDRKTQATGTRLEPDTFASGVVRLANPNPEVVTIPADTELIARDGGRYRTLEEITVPAALADTDPDTAPGGTVAGQGEVRIEALEKGSAWNRAVGELSGRMENGVYFSNRDGEITGGDDIQIPVVSEEDETTLKQMIDQELQGEALGDLVAAQLSKDLAIVPGSLTLGESSYEISPKIGVDSRGKEVVMLAEAIVTVLVYRPDDVRAQAAERLRSDLAAQAPPGYVLVDSSVQVGEAVALPEESGAVRFEVQAQGSAEAEFSEEERRQLRDDLVGVNGDDAEARLREVSEAERFSVTYDPGWLPDQMPRSADRIELVVNPEE